MPADGQAANGFDLLKWAAKLARQIKEGSTNEQRELLLKVCEAEAMLQGVCSKLLEAGQDPRGAVLQDCVNAVNTVQQLHNPPAQQGLSSKFVDKFYLKCMVSCSRCSTRCNTQHNYTGLCSTLFAMLSACHTCLLSCARMPSWQHPWQNYTGSVTVHTIQAGCVLRCV